MRLNETHCCEFAARFRPAQSGPLLQSPIRRCTSFLTRFTSPTLRCAAAENSVRFLSDLAAQKREKSRLSALFRGGRAVSRPSSSYPPNRSSVHPALFILNFLTGETPAISPPATIRRPDRDPSALQCRATLPEKSPVTQYFRIFS
jgi:hypothetical protein